MKNSEEKIKKFFSSEENVRKLMENEEFMNKISEGTADAETYQSEFKKLGLDLTDEEANQTAEITNKLLSTPPEKLKDISLENITGGCNGGYDPRMGLIAGGVASIPGLAAGIGTIACHIKSKKCEKSGDAKGALEYERAAIAFGTVSAVTLPLPLMLTIASGKSTIEYAIHSRKQRKQAQG